MDTKSTSGFFLEITKDQQDNDETPCGVPISWGAKKQTSTSSHTAEAEMLSMSGALRHEAIPLQLLLQMCCGVVVPIRIHDDNSACIVSATKGYSPSMRYLPRTQRIAIGSAHET